MQTALKPILQLLEQAGHLAGWHSSKTVIMFY